ncbi:MAG: nuclear transport factor 2 family protein [Acidimicrobiales bacterium]
MTETRSIDTGIIDNIATIRAAYDAFLHRDIDTIMSCIADEVDWGFQFDEDVPGAKAVPFLVHLTHKSEIPERFFSAVIQSLDIHRFEPQVFGAGDTVVSIIDQEATVRTTGRRLSFRSGAPLHFPGWQSGAGPDHR